MDWEKTIAAALDYVISVMKNHILNQKNKRLSWQIWKWLEEFYKIFGTFQKGLTAEWCKYQKACALAF